MILLATVVCLVAAAYYFRDTLGGHWTPYIIRFAKPLPGPPSIPIFGNVHHFHGNPEFFFKSIRHYCKVYMEYGYFKVWAIRKLIICIFNADDMQRTLTDTSDMEKNIIYKFLHWLGDGLLISVGDKWRRRRKMLTPAFHFNILKRFIGSFNTEADNLVETLREHDGQVIDVTPFMMKTSLRILCDTIMGLKITEENVDPYKNAIYEMGEIFIERLQKPWFISRTIFDLSALGRRFQKCVDIAHAFTIGVIKKRLVTLQSENAHVHAQSDDDTPIYKSQRTFLDTLLSNLKTDSNPNGLSFEDIREEVDTFMFEGHDTSAVGACFTLLCLANHPACQELIYQELQSISTGDFTHDDLAKMTYLEMCIKESLRLFPPVPGISRTLVKDLELKDFTVPKSVYVTLSIYDLHRNPKYWTDPDKYDPLRFTAANSVGRHPFCYVPFSGGPRNCIGQKYAMLELKTLMAKIVQNYRIEAVDTFDTIVCLMDLVIRTKHGIKMIFHRR